MVPKLNYYLDAEFIEDGQTIDLISIGIVCDDGREYYAEVDDVPWGKADKWVLKNVKPQLLGNGWIFTKKQIASDIVHFVSQGKGQPSFVGYYASYDWIVLCRLYGRMIDLPSGWPMYICDIKQWADDNGNPKLPIQDAGEHHALADARWNRTAHHWLLENVEND